MQPIARKEYNNMKKFKNLESYTEATQYIKNVFDVPVSEMELVEEQEKEVIAKIIWLFDNAKNSAVRAAIHHHALGEGLYLDIQEEKETTSEVYYENMFCEYFSQTRFYAQLKYYDGYNKTLRYLIRVETYVVEDETQKEYFTKSDYLKSFVNLV